jgi:hypothetical protein
MIDLSANIVLPSSNRNRICPTGRCRSGRRCRRRADTWITTLIGKVTFLPTSKTLPFPRQWVLSSMSPLNILIPSNRSLGSAGAWHRLALRSRISLPRYLRPWLEQRLSRTEHRSSGGRSDTWPELLPGCCRRTNLHLRSIAPLRFSSTRALFTIP